MKINALQALREHGDRCIALVREAPSQLNGPDATATSVGQFFRRVELAYAAFEELHADAEATEELDADTLVAFDDLDQTFTDLAAAVALALTRLRQS